MVYYRKIFLVVVLFAGVGLSSARAATITSFSDNFEGEVADTVINFTGWANWDVTNGSVDKILSPWPVSTYPDLDCQAGDGTICVDLDGTTSNAGDFTTKDSFAPGTYRLLFDIAGNQKNEGDSDTMTVTLGEFSQDFTLSSGEDWQTVDVTATVLTEGALTFSHAGGDNYGIILDNVSVSPVPVPAAAWLFISALGGMVVAKRKKA